ncbi:FecR family protein [Sinorhizobium meliloti]|uniref:FecR family protein n=1 Tax=Rhizobium meliloti TaxID=382 RepID=UPI003D652F58
MTNERSVHLKKADLSPVYLQSERDADYAQLDDGTMTPDDNAAELSKEATDWLIRIREAPDDPEMRLHFERWVTTSRDHRREWEKTCRLWLSVGALPAARDKPSAHNFKPGRRGGRASLAIAACAMAICLLVAWVPGLLIVLQSDYHTGTAETRSLELEDGSTVTLAPGSAIAMDFGQSRRSLRLLQGEAYFDVAHDPARPFVVDAGGLEIEVLGTAFDVMVDSESTRVSLERGLVTASPSGKEASAERRLTSGKALVFDRDAQDMTTSDIDAASIGAWRQGRLHVVNATISSVVERIQRYHPAWISLPDPVLGSQRVTGIYDLTAPDEALGALVDPYGGKVRRISSFARVISRF